MKAFLKPFDELQDINELKDRLQKHNREYFELSGVTSSGKAQVIYGISEVSEHSLVVVSDDLKAKELYEELSFYRDDVYIFPGKDMLFFQSDIRGNALTIPRVNVLARMVSGESFVVIATIDSMLNVLQKPDEWAKGIHVLKVGDEIDTKSFARELSAEGYERVTQVEQPGEYAIRGGILDIFSLTDTDPFRIELWGDEVDLIKRFNASDQKSTDQVESVKYYPACEFVLEEEDVDRGIEAMKAEMKEIYAKYRKEMKTEEAYHLKSTVEAAIEKMESGWIRQEGEVYLPYFLRGGKSVRLSARRYGLLYR
jgi:transcription-repair coupling factor (superfamily II helicase)